MVKETIAAAILAVSLSGCGLVSAGTLSSTITDAAGQADMLLPTLVMQKAAVIHNLSVGLAAIQAAPGMVVMTPSVSTAAPVVMPAPAPVTTAPAPTPVTGIPTAPTTNG